MCQPSARLRIELLRPVTSGPETLAAQTDHKLVRRILNRVQNGHNGQICVVYLVTKWKYQAK